ncbi:dihydropteroate synthase [Pseudochryseolinea flava]|uniref:dihydropteroate synthase n=2 Tax=Pseudochryseolinea flava TaxID=2059302 RepID=A0A364XZX1_9BACT|nr:dihydropteroate synthase [Pseudochryseolinea flava]
MKSASESKLFSTNKTLNFQGRLVDLSTPAVMGILNITPDSFYGGSRVRDEKSILGKAEEMLRQGATFLDVGGYSTRPGADEISMDEEIHRVTHALTIIHKAFPEALLSVDTFRSAVARAAVQAGASMINDVSGGTLDDAMFKTVGDLQVPYVLMHMRGTPQTMASQTNYTNLMKDLVDFFHQNIHQLEQHAVKDVIIDPGFGFAKTVTQNFELLNGMEYLNMLGKPMMIGLSRKSMIWRTLGITADDAMNGTTALNTIAVMKGAGILRVHDVAEAVQVVKLTQALVNR